MFLNVFTGVCKFGKVRQTKETLADFLKKLKCLKKKKKKNLPLHVRIIFLRYVKDCKGVRSMDFN